MSTQYRSTIVGLATPGLFWLATSVASGQGGIALQAPPSSPASTSSTYSVLLLNSGKVVRGTITRDPSGANYILKQGGVPIAYPAAVVQTAGGTIEDLYQYRVARLAERDPDERMKLARWCMTEGLIERSKEQIEAILEMCPGDPEATRMKFSLAATAEREAQLAGRAAMVDPGVSRTGGEMPRADVPANLDPNFVAGQPEAPADMDPKAVKNARRDFNNILPVIFDLPPAQAVARARTFTQNIHPILQRRCASCHGERYTGTFQLVLVKGRRDMNPDVARANLDATLRLVNPDDLPRSEILSAGLVPHGGNKNAVFRGPNDVEYRVLDVWVRSLRATGPGANGVVRAGFGEPQAAAPGDGFAVDRANRPASAGMPLAPVVPVPGGNGFPPQPGAPAQPSAASPNPAPGYLPGESYRVNADFSGGLPDSAFPVPYAVGGEPPESIKPRKAATAAPARATTATPVDANTVLVPPSDHPSRLPGMDQEHYPPQSGAGKKGKAAEPDRKLLEQLIKKRNGNP